MIPTKNENITFGTAFKERDKTKVPQRQQTVTDEKGKRRLHGAFTGGFAAGFWNTVGSEEGWTPSTFSSFRNQKENVPLKERTIEDYMDDEDRQDMLAKAMTTGKGFNALSKATAFMSDAQKLEQRKKFDETFGLSELPFDFFQYAKDDSIGVSLLKKIGWKEGHGIGARILNVEQSKRVIGPEVPDELIESVVKNKEKRQNRFGFDETADIVGEKKAFLLLTNSINTQVVHYEVKNDFYGIGYDPIEQAPDETMREVQLARLEKEEQKKRITFMSALSGEGDTSGAFGKGVFEDEDEIELYGKDKTDYFTTLDDDDGEPFPKRSRLEIAKKNEKKKIASHSFDEELERLKGCGFVETKDNIHKLCTIFGFCCAVTADQRPIKYPPPIPAKDFKPLHVFKTPCPTKSGSTNIDHTNLKKKPIEIKATTSEERRVLLGEKIPVGMLQKSESDQQKDEYFEDSELKSTTIKDHSDAYEEGFEAARKLLESKPAEKAEKAAQLPTDSVFYSMTKEAQQKMANATGKVINAQFGEIIPHKSFAAPQLPTVTFQPTKKDMNSNQHALIKPKSRFVPSKESDDNVPVYFSDPVKQNRYKIYYQSAKGISPLPFTPPDNLTAAQWDAEMAEFANIFFINQKSETDTRFVRSTETYSWNNQESGLEFQRESSKLSKEDLAVNEAKLKQFKIVRTTSEWYPEPLLSRRFNVPPIQKPESNDTRETKPFVDFGSFSFTPTSDAVRQKKLQTEKADSKPSEAKTVKEERKPKEEPKVEIEVSQARPSIDIFKSIFGDDGI